MKKKGKSWQFFAVAILIFLFAWTAFFGISYQYGDTVTTYIKGAQDIRFGIVVNAQGNEFFEIFLCIFQIPFCKPI